MCVCEVEQFPVPKNVQPPWNVAQKAPPTKQEAPPTKQEAPPTKSTAPSAPASSTQPKKEKEPKKAKGGGKGGGAESAATVDVSRLDMRVGRIQKAWKHPDADGLYVEEGEVVLFGCCSHQSDSHSHHLPCLVAWSDPYSISHEPGVEVFTW